MGASAPAGESERVARAARVGIIAGKAQGCCGVPAPSPENLRVVLKEPGGVSDRVEGVLMPSPHRDSDRPMSMGRRRESTWDALTACGDSVRHTTTVTARAMLATVPIWAASGARSIRADLLGA